MSDQERNEHNESQTIINATETKAEVTSDHSQNQNALPNNNNNKYGDLTNLLHAAAALSQLPGNESSAGQEKTERSDHNPIIPVSDDDAKTVPSKTKEDKEPQHDRNPPPSYRPPLYHANGMLLVPSSNHMHMMQSPQQLHASGYGQDGKKKRPYTNTRHTFPLKLMEILNSKYNFSDIIRWSENGTSFQVIDPNKLCETVLPLYFPGEKVKYPSFTRKLNRWGFRQISRGPDGGAFFHEWFLRDKPDICKDMICKPSVRKGSYIKSFGKSVGELPMTNDIQGPNINGNHGYGYHLHKQMFQPFTGHGPIPFHVHQRPLPTQSRARFPMPCLPLPSQPETAGKNAIIANEVAQSFQSDVKVDKEN